MKQSLHKISLSLHGCKAGTPPSSNNHVRALRKTVGGWSSSSSRRNIDFLRSVEPNSLTGIGIAFTGTLKTCPPSSDDWHRLRNAFDRRLRRMGLIRSHWVTEWQRRGVPHLHCALWFPDCTPEETIKLRLDIIRHWLAVNTQYGASSNGQHLTMLTDAIGWFQYVAKHAARGVGHYQRSPENVPQEWKMKTGRMWGKTGDWATREPLTLTIPSDSYHAFRRMCRNWRIADARATGNRYRIKSARNMLKCNERGFSVVRGVSEWLPIEASTSLAYWACQLSRNPEQIEHT